MSNIPQRPNHETGLGRTVLVTGASRGIGRELARQLAERGWRVMLGVRDLDVGMEVALEMRGRVEVVKFDVANPEAAQRVARAVGPVDALVNNAAVDYDTWQSALSADIDAAERSFRTNLFGAWRASRAFAHGMRERGWGRIVNVSSGEGQLRSIGATTPSYSLSKLALNGLTRALADELKGTRVLVNAVCPGWVATDMGGLGGRPVSDGAASVRWAVELPDDGPTGYFFRDEKPISW